MANLQQQQGLTTLLIKRWEQTSQKLEELAAAIPESDFDSRPLEGVRTLGDVLRHVAFWNQYVADALQGKTADGSANELPRETYPTKADVLKTLSGSSTAVTAALGGEHRPFDLKTAEMIVTFIEHTSEHYGQLVVYTRLMGIVPPASRS